MTHLAGSAGSPPTIVGIGASAGGLRALQLFFESVPADSGMAYVVIMHLDPERESRIAAILQDRTPVPVTQVTRTTTVEADRVYVIPPGYDLEMVDTAIRVLARSDHPQHSPVDLFFRTLAEARGADAVAVVLSGTGSDGAAGIRHVREHGGITVAQAPDEADYDGMPSAAIATGQVDLVLPSARIPAELLRLRRTPSPLTADTPPADTEAQLARVFAALRGKTGHDFHLYKRPTVLRRLERRLRFNDAGSVEEYLPLLQGGDDAEARALVRDLLISVSGFFRDPEAFRALGEAVPALFEGKEPDDAVRVWIAGCATGEEAYSIAILLAEHAATLERPPRVQMFATDIDEKGYAWGRDALYPASAVADVAPGRLSRFFVQEAGGYRVVKPLREMVLFAVHNVLRDPPFARLDMVSCRNLLIYLQPEAQEQVLGAFHYALRPGGLLFLGASESAGESGLFVPAAGPQRIYHRDASPRRALPRISAADPAPRPAGPPAGAADGRRAQGFSYGALHLRMLEAYAPPSLVVDEGLEVVHLSGGAGRYLHLGEGEPSRNLIDLSRGDLRVELRTALYQALEKGLPTTRRVRADGNGGGEVTLRVTPIAGDEGGGRFALVVFEELAWTEAGPEAPDAAVRGREVARLEEELRRAREQLEYTSVARDRTVEELRAANDEMHSVNEEQRAASEELETSREEIQSINEELTTINQEHQNTIEELKRTNADLRNLIESTEIGTIFLDREMRVRRFTPAVEALFNFVETDRGRPLAHITHRLRYGALEDDARSVLGSLERIEREVSSETGEWYVVRISPYRAPDDSVDGAVLTFFDITAQKHVEEALREAKAVAEAANQAKGTFLATLSHEFRTPLTGILGYADVLHFGGPLTPGQEQMVARIKAGGWHLASMIDEILSFAKLDEGRERVRYENLDAREVAREAKALVEGGAEEKGLAFALDLPAEAVGLETDGAKARQVLVNLCGNAVKYTERGEVRLGVHAEEERVVFEVRDTGIGIAPEHHARVFERFWQVDGASTRSHGGMGIGLAAAREFSRLLGGGRGGRERAGPGEHLPRVAPPCARRRLIHGPYGLHPSGERDATIGIHRGEPRADPGGVGGVRADVRAGQRRDGHRGAARSRQRDAHGDRRGPQDPAGKERAVREVEGKSAGRRSPRGDGGRGARSGAGRKRLHRRADGLRVPCPACQRDPAVDQGAGRGHARRPRRPDAVQRGHRPVARRIGPRYGQNLDQSKELFLAMLGHDLRTPLGAIYTSARFMLDTEELKEPHLTLTSRIASSSTRMVQMVGDLLDFTRGRLGGGIPIVCADLSMERVVRDVVDEIGAAHPHRALQVDVRGEEWGEWDCARISQALTNLIANAVQHG
ncbi:MAG TPA: chemotaxis protein CheB, partial [Longimicrobiaceae bacterium]